MEIKRLTEEEARKQYKKRLEDKFNYIGEINFIQRDWRNYKESYINHGKIASFLNLGDYSESLVKGLKVIREKDEILNKYFLLKEEVKKLTSDYAQKRKRKEEIPKEEFRKIILPEIEEMINKLIPSFNEATTRREISFAEDEIEKNYKSLSKTIKTNLATLLDKKLFTGDLKNMSRKYWEFERAEEAYKTLETAEKRAPQNTKELIHAMGIPREKELFKDESLAYTKIDKVLETAAWLFFKYPCNHIIPNGTIIEIPKSLIIEEGYIKEADEENRWTVSYDRDYNDYFHC